jgi:Zn-dependent membrane protease YugP
MQGRWKLAGLALLGLALIGILILLIGIPVLPAAPLQASVQIRSGDIVDEADPRIVKTILGAFALLVVGVLAWVARHVHGRNRGPDA